MEATKSACGAQQAAGSQDGTQTMGRERGPRADFPARRLLGLERDARARAWPAHIMQLWGPSPRTGAAFRVSTKLLKCLFSS